MARTKKGHGDPNWASSHHRSLTSHHHSANNSSNKLLKTALWMVWVPIVAVLWVMLLDTSYDWISSPSTSKVVAGLLILVLMACAVLGLVIKGARKLWTR